MTWPKEKTDRLKALIAQQMKKQGYVDFAQMACIMNIQKRCLYAKCRIDKIEYKVKDQSYGAVHKFVNDIEWLNSKKVNYG